MLLIGDAKEIITENGVKEYSDLCNLSALLRALGVNAGVICR